MLLSLGIVTSIVAQALFNISVVLSLVPTKESRCRLFRTVARRWCRRSRRSEFCSMSRNMRAAIFLISNCRLPI